MRYTNDKPISDTYIKCDCCNSTHDRVDWRDGEKWHNYLGDWYCDDCYNHAFLRQPSQLPDDKANMTIVGYLLVDEDGKERIGRFANWEKIGGNVKQVFPSQCIGFVALVGRKYQTFRLEANES